MTCQPPQVRHYSTGVAARLGLDVPVTAAAGRAAARSDRFEGLGKVPIQIPRQGCRWCWDGREEVLEGSLGCAGEETLPTLQSPD